MTRILALLLALCFSCQGAVANAAPSEYTFAKTRQMVIDEQHTEVGKIMNSAGSYLEILQTKRGLNLALACVALGAIAYFFNLHFAAFAFGGIAAFILLINRPLIGSMIILPIIIFKWTKLKDPMTRPVFAKNGLELLPDSVKERKAERMQGQLNPMKDASVAVSQVGAPKIARPL